MTNAFLNRCTAPQVLSRGSRTRKFKHYLALLLFGAFAGSVVAQTTLTYDDGDLFLGFRATDGTSDYLVNIKQPDQFVNAPPGSTFQVATGNLSLDLVIAFGSDWYTRIDPSTGRNAVLWAVTGGREIAASGDPANVLYSTNPISNPWPRHSDTAQSFSTSLIAAMGNSFSGNQSTPNNPMGLIQNTASNNSYASFQPDGANSNGVSFQTWNPSNEAGPATGLFFDRIVPGSGPSALLGAFVLTNDGQLSFTATGGPTPTPSATPTATATATASPTATATATGTPAATPTATATATATPTATATVAPTPTPRPATLGNISTRLQVGTGANVMIAGFVVQGSASKRVLVRATGPSLTQFGVPNALANPQLELHNTSSIIGMNDDWQTTQIGGVITADQVAEIQNSGLAPGDPLESAIIAVLAPGSYSAIVQGVNGGTGVGIVEVYDLDPASGSFLANIATRGFVQTGDNAMIGGFIVVTQSTRVIIRAIGPSLSQFGVPDVLANPQLELHDLTSIIAQNDDWQTTQLGGIITSDQVAEIQNSQLAPTNPAEAAIIATLAPGSYTAIVRGVNNTTGNALVEVYSLQ